MKISFPTVEWDTFDKVWINFLISDDLAQTGLSDWFLESEVNQRGWVKSSLGTHVGGGGFLVRWDNLCHYGPALVL